MRTTISSATLTAIVILATLVSAPQSQAQLDLQPPRSGSCWMLGRAQLNATSWPTDTQSTDCSQWHSLEITGTYRPTTAIANRGRLSPAMKAFARARCLASVQQYQGRRHSNTAFLDMWWIASQETWDQGGQWVVCGGTPKVWVGNDRVYGRTQGAFRPSLFSPACGVVSNRHDLTGRRCTSPGARPYSRMSLDFRYLPLMRYPGWNAVERRCASMAGSRSWACTGRDRRNWNRGIREVYILDDHGVRRSLPRLNIRPI